MCRACLKPMRFMVPFTPSEVTFGVPIFHIWKLRLKKIISFPKMTQPGLQPGEPNSATLSSSPSLAQGLPEDGGLMNRGQQEHSLQSPWEWQAMSPALYISRPYVQNGIALSRAAMVPTGPCEGRETERGPSNPLGHSDSRITEEAFVSFLPLYRSIVEDPSVPTWGLHKLIGWKFQLLWIELARAGSGAGAECWKATYSKLRK